MDNRVVAEIASHLADWQVAHVELAVPVPYTVYHHSKLEAEHFLQSQAAADFAVRVIRMSRCFPELPELMALYRIHRGIDVRDAATAHVAALSNSGPAYQMYVVSGRTPFVPSDCDQLGRSAREVLAVRCPALVAEYAKRNWPLPSTIDRVYAPQLAEKALGWRAKWGSAEVFRQYDDGDIEVLPRNAQSGNLITERQASRQTDWPWDASLGGPRAELSGCESG
jgi:nucleoside-diphosphate-sugar epimerase